MIMEDSINPREKAQARQRKVNPEEYGPDGKPIDIREPRDVAYDAQARDLVRPLKPDTAERVPIAAEATEATKQEAGKAGKTLENLSEASHGGAQAVGKAEGDTLSVLHELL